MGYREEGGRQVGPGSVEKVPGTRGRNDNTTRNPQKCWRKDERFIKHS